MPEFKERETVRQQRKAEALAPYVARAMARKQRLGELAEDEIPSFVALGRRIAEQGKETEQQRRNSREMVRKFASAAGGPAEGPRSGGACDGRQYCSLRRCCRPVAGLSRAACMQPVTLSHRP